MPRYTPEQGQYLAFIYYYTKIHRRSPVAATGIRQDRWANENRPP